MIINVYCSSTSTNIKFQTDLSIDLLLQLSKVNYSRWVPRLIKNEIKSSFQSVVWKNSSIIQRICWIEKDLAQYWSNWCCKLLFWGER